MASCCFRVAGWPSAASDSSTAFAQITRDYGRLPKTMARLHFVIFAMLVLVHAPPITQST